ncbi:hypothetical protein LSH36_118g01037 [Paralvinella palmiformis]|uniref:Rap-GAP domain-containing protein n=1 Tax=Paralvinella palmiformis TaxID=53620 RepID=A0AAD9JZI7_9ANNE|nr:hypothetical protein LSH36_118g01037 [Paralvinella palmiformis]
MSSDDMPDFSSLKPGQDALDQLLHYIGRSSPECQLQPGEPLNMPFSCPEQLTSITEGTIIKNVLHQKDEEETFYNHHQNDASMVAQPMYPMENIDVSSPYHLCRLFLNQLGFLQWEKRLHFDLLKKSDKLLRELKHIDSQRCRETHKIAVIYVAEGQEDKQSILSNTMGSLMYEQFVAGLGWEVELESHQGFMGGLQSNGSTGNTAPYYATSTQEVIYHVATRMPSEQNDDIHRKLRHLGNDEVQIIWSEHRRDYRRGIIPTEFGDVLIIIYPLQNGLFRIQINRKPEVPYIGPLFDGAIVDDRILPGLVRATAITAGRILRLQKPYYKSFYEERAICVEDIVRQHKELTMFEEFAAQVFAPVQPQGDPMGSQVSLSEPLSVQTSQFYSSLCSDSDSIHSRGSTGKVSPHTAKAKDTLIQTLRYCTALLYANVSNAENSFQRRLSFGKSKKSVSKQAHLQMAAQTTIQLAAPESPNVAKSKK